MDRIGPQPAPGDPTLRAILADAVSRQSQASAAAIERACLEVIRTHRGGVRVDHWNLRTDVTVDLEVPYATIRELWHHEDPPIRSVE